MYSPEQLYDYLRYYCYVNKKNVTVRHFKTDGSKNLDELYSSDTPYAEEIIGTTITESHDAFRKNSGFMEMFDQEPVDIQAFYNETYSVHEKTFPNTPRLKLGINDYVASESMAIYTPIICHSEKNSDDINNLSETFYTPVHFWSNAITSRYWYSHYKILKKSDRSIDAKRFGTYIRDVSGTRTYRTELLRFLKYYTLRQTYRPESTDAVPSYASASIPWYDCAKFDIHVVPETIFDTEKTHLTEKIFKPIVMYQPFILFAGPNSLQYMRNYGFKTFDSVWDESYDLETDADARFKKATQLIEKIALLNDKDYKRLLEKTNTIVKFNRDHFYSTKFENILLKELHTNLDNALHIQEENFYKIPGGTLFYYADLCYKLSGKRIKQIERPLLLHDALAYAEQKSPAVAKEIIKKYGYLL